MKKIDLCFTYLQNRHFTTMDDTEYVVECILDHRTDGDGYSYFVKWEGFDYDECTWEPEANLTDCQYLISSYWEQNADYNNESILEEHSEELNREEKKQHKRKITQKTKKPTIDKNFINFEIISVYRDKWKNINYIAKLKSGEYVIIPRITIVKKYMQQVFEFYERNLQFNDQIQINLDE